MIAFYHYDLTVRHVLDNLACHSPNVGRKAYLHVAFRKRIAETELAVMRYGKIIHHDVANLKGIIKKLYAPRWQVRKNIRNPCVQVKRRVKTFQKRPKPDNVVGVFVGNKHGVDFRHVKPCRRTPPFKLRRIQPNVNQYMCGLRCDVNHIAAAART